MSAPRRLLLAAVSGVLVLAVALLYQARTPRPPRGFADVPLADCPALRGVVEPITMVEGFFWDNTSRDLTYRDARGRRMRCLVALDERDPSNEYLFLADVTDPGRRTDGQVYPRRGPEARAVAGLLERWERDTPAARDMSRRIDLALPEDGPEFTWPDDAEGVATFTALCALRTLRVWNR